MTGKTHTPETVSKMSDSQQLVDRSGAINPMYGRNGALNPMFGKVAPNAITVSVYSLDGTLVNSFSSRVAAAKWLGVSDRSVLNYIRSGKVFNGLYLLTSSLLS